ncbi:MAG: hypothetical protein HY320_13675 [Armatimonadetes bacterium]|nr:hypothetical protein [Armatimonadota bacterium]
MAAGLIFFAGLGMVILAFLIPSLGLEGNTQGAFYLLFGGGLALIAFGVIGSLFSCYRKTKANEALVITGGGGGRVILDRGGLVIPFLHQWVPVSLETMKLEVERQGQDALITQDNLRVDVKAEFYIRVNPTTQDILQAARSLGHKSVDAESVSRLVFEKLVSALRSVAAQKDLGAIHTDRKGFASAVQELVSEELAQNGLLLETVTISRLDQTDPHGLSDENIFDAQGKKKITEITAAARVERNRLERLAEQQITQQNVETTQKVLGLERQRAEAESTQARDVSNVKAERQREQQAFLIEQERAVKEAEIQRDLAVQAAGIERDKALITKDQERQQTDILRAQAVEVADRLKQIAIAEREAERAKAEQAALAAQAERERANQQIKTVEATAQADREAQTKLIAAKQVIEQDKIKRQTDAEVAAYAEVRKAEATQKAADLEAQAQLRLADAEAKAKEMVAQGEQAQRMVEVNVEREKVNVEQARVDVERRALENRQTFDRAAIEFETAKLRIEADKEVQMAVAQALGQFMARGNYNVYGDPTTMAAMFQQFTRGMRFSTQTNGFLATLPEPLRELLSHLGSNAEEIVRELAARLGNGRDGGDAAAEEKAPTPVPEPVGPPAPIRSGRAGPEPTAVVSTPATGEKGRERQTRPSTGRP